MEMLTREHLWFQKALSLHVRPVEVEHNQVLELALARGVSTHDAAYLRVALRSGGELLTFDRRLKQAAEGPPAGYP